MSRVPSHPSSRRRLALSGFSIAVLAATANLSAADITKVIMTGDAAPGVPGATIKGFGTPAINNLGQVSFAATLNTGTGITTGNDALVYAGHLGALNPVVREGTDAPDVAGLPGDAVIGSPSVFNYTDDGRVAFSANVSGTGITSLNNAVNWIGSPGNTPDALMRKGTAAPGVPGATVASLLTGENNRFVTSTGKYLQRVTVSGDGFDFTNNLVLYHGATSNFTPVARQGGAVPDGPAGALIKDFPVIVTQGDHVAFRGQMIAGAGGVTADVNDSGLWVTNSAGGLKLAARKGDAIGGLPGLVAPGTRIAAVADEMAINKNGVVLAFSAKLAADGDTATVNDDDVVTVGSATAAFTVVAREGRQIPGQPGLFYGDSFGDGRIGADGTILLPTVVTGAGVTQNQNSTAIVFGKPDDLRMVARGGMQAPGFTPDFTFQLGSFSGSRFNVNDVGGLSLLAGVTNGTDSYSVLFATDSSDGELMPLVKTHDLLEVAPGVFKEISALSVSLNSNFQTVNSLNQIAFNATFTDGSSGIFLADVSAVPEPATFSLLALGGLGLLRRNRRR